MKQGSVMRPVKQDYSNNTAGPTSSLKCSDVLSTPKCTCRHVDLFHSEPNHEYNGLRT